MARALTARCSWVPAFAGTTIASFVLGIALLTASARAENYPARPVTMIVPFGPGSATDTISRVVAQPLGVALKQSVVVENRQGANGGLAAAYVARAPADGYTLLMSGNSPHSANPFLVKNAGYDPIADFAPVSRTGSFTLLLVVNAESMPICR
jgi:tripartite-type tricarboxylate transporter receptor subunit TctC